MRNKCEISNRLERYSNDRLYRINVGCFAQVYRHTQNATNIARGGIDERFRAAYLEGRDGVIQPLDEDRSRRFENEMRVLEEVARFQGFVHAELIGRGLPLTVERRGMRDF